MEDSAKFKLQPSKAYKHDMVGFPIIIYSYLSCVYDTQFLHDKPCYFYTDINIQIEDN